MFREKRFKNKKKLKEADRKDPVRSHRPDLPVTGPGERLVSLTEFKRPTTAKVNTAGEPMKTLMMCLEREKT